MERNENPLIADLYRTAVRCSTLETYNKVRSLYWQAGVNVWPWHKGFKHPSDDEHNCPWYGFEYQGFMKHIHTVGECHRLTVNQLEELVNSKEYSQWVRKVD